jgi:SGNH hydrolase-like domain, acetyltransferase AlgX
VIHSRHGSTIGCLLAVVAWWGGTAWLARQPAPWAIRLTNPAFAAGLLWTCLAAATIIIRGARDRRTMLFRIAAATMALGGCVSLFEVAAAAGLIDFHKIRSVLAGGEDERSVDFLADHELSFRRPPHAHSSGRPRSNMAETFNLPIRSPYVQTFSTDGHGFRNAIDLTRADIALVGDSYIEGAYVSDQETAAVRLQERLGQPIANLGVSGYGSLQELKVIEKYGVPLAPKMVAWFFFEGNDLDDDQDFENAMAYEQGVPAPPHPPESASRRWQDRVERSFTLNAFMMLRKWSDYLVPNGIDSFGWFRDRDGASHRMYFYDFYATRSLGPYEQQRFETTKAAFRQGAEICRQHGIRLVAVYIPIKFRVYGDLCSYPPGSRCVRWKPWNLEEQFAAFCRSAGIEFLSLTEPMHRAAAAGQLVYAPEDSHWSAEGQRFVAGQIAKLVRDGK